MHRSRLTLACTLALMLGAVARLPLATAQSSGTSEPSERSAERAESRDEGDRDERRESWRSRYRGRDSRRGRDSDERATGSDAERAQASSPPSSGVSRSSARSTSSSTSEGASMEMSDYARSLVKKHDRNGNMMLEAEERRELGGRAAEADLNKDGVITIDELVAHLSTGTSGGSNRSSSRSSSGSDENSSDRDDRDRDRRERYFNYRRGDRDRDSDERRSNGATTAKRVYFGSAGPSNGGDSEKEKSVRRTWRFMPPGERLPSGLPSWFKSRDANGDGQVSMSEYSRSWSQRSVQEFRALDLNDDGVITPGEAAAAKQ